MSYRDKHRGPDRGDGRRGELRLLEDEPDTRRYDRPALWRDEPPPSRERSSRGRASHGRSRRSRPEPARWPQAPSRDHGDRADYGGEDWSPDWDREDWRDRYKALRARSRWPLAFSAGVVVLLFFGALMLVQPPGTAGVLGGPCATASCDRVTPTAPGPAKPSATASAPSAAPSSPASSASAPAPSATASGSAPPARTSASPGPSVNPALRSVQVSYTLVKRMPGGFEGQFTIVNKSRTVIRDWQLVMVLPDDHVESAWDASFQEVGNTVTLVPPSYALNIPAGARITEQFTATGTTTRPVSCTFSGVPC
ncbi:MAG: cellulose binding domain-containing protein [Streptosporangiaceae bacterium]